MRTLGEKVGNRPCDSNQRGDDCGGIVWLFCKYCFLAVMFVEYSLRAWRRQCGCGIEQLCGLALQKPPYELVALLLGRRMFGRPLCHGVLFDPGHGLELRLFQYICFTACIDDYSFLIVALMEEESGRER